MNMQKLLPVLKVSYPMVVLVPVTVPVIGLLSPLSDCVFLFLDYSLVVFVPVPLQVSGLCSPVSG